ADAYGVFVSNAGDPYTRRVYNNTIDLPSARVVFIKAGAVDIKNNIGPLGASNLSTSDAYFVNKSLHNYHLVAGKAPVDTGINTGVTADRDGVPRPQGKADDIGAYEYVGPIPTPTPTPKPSPTPSSTPTPTPSPSPTPIPTPTPTPTPTPSPTPTATPTPTLTPTPTSTPTPTPSPTPTPTPTPTPSPSPVVTPI